MPETVWGPDVVPHGLTDFDSVPAEGAWDLLDSPLPYGAFQSAAVPWSDQDWMVGLGFLMPGENGAVFFARRPLIIQQAVNRSATW